MLVIDLESISTSVRVMSALGSPDSKQPSLKYSQPVPVENARYPSTPWSATITITPPNLHLQPSSQQSHLNMIITIMTTTTTSPTPPPHRLSQTSQEDTVRGFHTKRSETFPVVGSMLDPSIKPETTSTEIGCMGVRTVPHNNIKTLLF